MGEAIRSITSNQNLKIRELESRIRSLEIEQRTRRLLPVQEYLEMRFTPPSRVPITTGGLPVPRAIPWNTNQMTVTYDPGATTVPFTDANVYMTTGPGVLFGSPGYWLYEAVVDFDWDTPSSDDKHLGLWVFELDKRSEIPAIQDASSGSVTITGIHVHTALPDGHNILGYELLQSAYSSVTQMYVTRVTTRSLRICGLDDRWLAGARGEYTDYGLVELA